MDHIEITHDVLTSDAIVQQITSPSCGAISIFLGTTRDNFEGKKVLRLEYEGYAPMAKKELCKICKDIREKWEVENIAIVHRLGVVPVTETSVIIGISSSHRKESLEAVQYAIDKLKATVPIWKKEIYEGGSDWKANKECSWKEEK